MEKVISFEQFVRNADRVASDVEKRRTIYRIKNGARRDLALVDWEWLDGWMAASELMRNPNWRVELEQNERDVVAGRTIPLEDVLTELGLDVTPSNPDRAKRSARSPRHRASQSSRSASRPRGRAAKRSPLR